jgi:uncharacterized protein (UPF0332 family)
MSHEADIFFSKAEESLAGAESEFANGRFNNCANRSYYSCFQAAVAGLLREGVRPADPRQQWGHAYVQSQFVGQLINRRKRFPAELRDVLARCLILRQTADYAPDDVTETRAARTLQRARAFVEALYVEGGDQR